MEKPNITGTVSKAKLVKVLDEIWRMAKYDVQHGYITDVQAEAQRDAVVTVARELKVSQAFINYNPSF